MYIFTNQGLGDHIICNGIIRKYAETEDVVLFCRKDKYEHVLFMYRDIDIKLLVFDTNNDIKKYISANKLQPKIAEAHTKKFATMLHDDNIKLGFDELYYYMANIDFNIRFNNFYIERDLEQEDMIYKLTNSLDEKYIYVHDDPKLKFIIDNNKHRQDLKIIRNQPQTLLFNMRKILENATEIHTMQTGMFDFCNSIKLNCPIFLHTYVRKYPNEKWISKGLNNITIIR